MKNKWIIASALIVALMMVCVASLFAAWQGISMVQGRGFRLVGLDANQVSVEATQEKTLTVDGPVNLNVNTSQGNITVKPGKDGQVIVKSEITAWGNDKDDAQATLKDIKVVIDQNANDVKISVEPAIVVDTLHIGPRSGRVNFTITVPAETVATLSSTTGDLSLSDTSGNADLETQFGSVSISNVKGGISGKSANGKITAKDIESKGPVTLSSEFGSVTAENVQGSDITLSSSNGQLNGLKNVHATGLLKISTAFGDIHLNGAQAQSADIRSNNGSIDLEKTTLGDTLTVKSDFGSLTLQDVRAKSYDLKTNNGKISLDGAAGQITAHSDFGSITVLNAQNALLDLSSNNGGVSFSGSLANGPHTLHSDFGNVTITLPSDSALNVDLQTDFGKIKSTFNITMNGDMDSHHWSGTINGGGAALTIDTKNGNITVQSSK